MSSLLGQRGYLHRLWSSYLVSWTHRPLSNAERLCKPAENLTSRIEADRKPCVAYSNTGFFLNNGQCTSTCPSGSYADCESPNRLCNHRRTLTLLLLTMVSYLQDLQELLGVPRCCYMRLDWSSYLQDGR